MSPPTNSIRIECVYLPMTLTFGRFSNASDVNRIERSRNLSANLLEPLGLYRQLSMPGGDFEYHFSP